MTEDTALTENYAKPETEPSSFEEFWVYYLSEHLSPGSRALHYAGSTVGLFLAALFVTFWHPVCGFCILPAAYGLAWIGHFFIEKNRPATWRYPRWSLVAESKMLWYALTGRLRGEFERVGLPFGRP